MTPITQAHRPNHLSPLRWLRVSIFLLVLLPLGRADSLTLRFKAPHWLYIEGDPIVRATTVQRQLFFPFGDN